MSSEVKLLQQQLEQTRANLAIALLFIGIFAVSCSPILIRLSEKEISPNGTIFFREAIAAVVFGLWSGFNSARRRISQDESRGTEPHKITQFMLLIAAGILATASILTFAWSLAQTAVANSTVIHSLVPVFTTLGAWVVFNQHFDRTFLIGLIIAISGAIAIGVQDVQISVNHLQGDLLSLLSVILYSGYLLLVEQMRSEVDTSTILLWRCSVGTVLLLPMIFIAKEQLFPTSFSGWLAVISVAIVGQVIGQGLVAYSLKKLSSGFVALSFLLSPALSAILAWFVFSENLSLLNWLSFFVILLGIYLAISTQEVVNK
ncbi:MAG: DMT family transporter [Heteroscytonema crispum UTEX LB 1556]